MRRSRTGQECRIRAGCDGWGREDLDTEMDKCEYLKFIESRCS